MNTMASCVNSSIIHLAYDKYFSALEKYSGLWQKFSQMLLFALVSDSIEVFQVPS
jgi:hypothetical protein